jgi:digeranylgeranylglycerophospholipid reductase
MQDKYDAVVVGAGPAGSMAAYEIAAAGFSVLLLEKHERPGVPLACAEAVSRVSLENLITPKKDWISTEINKATVIGPEGNTATAFYQGGGYILDRKKFDFYLAERAVETGATLACNSIGLGLAGEAGRFDTIDVWEKNGERTNIKASVFIAADGVESKIARLAGIENLVDIDKGESLLQYRLENIEVDPETILFYVGNKVAPGGYLYVFPKSEHTANVGLGVITDTERSEILEKNLNEFVESNFKGSEIREKMCGLTPKYMGKAMFRRGNLLVAGDAARALDSFSGAGIINAMTSGRFAGLAAAEYLRGRIEDDKEFDRLYPGRFMDERGDELRTYSRLKVAYRHLDDDDFAEVIDALDKHLAGKDVREMKITKLMMAVIMSRPRLVRLAKYVV